jgi:hypothetical protein
VAHLVELARARQELLLREFAHGLAKDLVLGCVEEVVRHAGILRRADP